MLYLGLTARYCVLLASFVLTSAMSIGAWADDYSDGMRAYMAKNYQLAQTHWLKAAQNKDPKSMFNLGFLHEQALLPEASLSKAESWYRLAGQNGYPAADYHLAQLLQRSAPIAGQARVGAAEELLRRSAANGYTPAQQVLGDVGVATAGAPRPTLQNEAWIRAQNGSDWTIQLLAFENLDKVHEFINTHGLRAQAAYFVERSGQGVLYKLIYGAYKDKSQAEKARQLLPSSLKQHGPWLRTLGSVQKVLPRN